MTHTPGGLFIEQVSPPASVQWPLSGDRMAIGRDPSADIVVDDQRISRHHADIIRQGSNWMIVDAGSTNGTFVNGARVHEAPLRPRDRICMGEIELVVRQPDQDYSEQQRYAPDYNVGWQQGNISNVAGNQANYYRESNLQYIASLRGRARLLIVSGIVSFLVGGAIAIFDETYFGTDITNSINSLGPSSSQPEMKVPSMLFPLYGVAAFLVLLGAALFVFGLITRSDARKEAQRLGAYWT